MAEIANIPPAPRPLAHPAIAQDRRRATVVVWLGRLGTLAALGLLFTMPHDPYLLFTMVMYGVVALAFTSAVTVKRKRLFAAWQRGQLEETVPVLDSWYGPMRYSYNFRAANVAGWFISRREIAKGTKLPVLVDSQAVVVFVPHGNAVVVKRVGALPPASVHRQPDASPRVHD